MEKMENMENPKKLAVATIAGLTEVAGMAAPAMADETAADPMVGQTQSADPTKDALDKANTAVSESQTAYDNAQQNVQDAQSKVDDAYLPTRPRMRRSPNWMPPSRLRRMPTSRRLTRRPMWMPPRLLWLK